MFCKSMTCRRRARWNELFKRNSEELLWQRGREMLPLLNSRVKNDLIVKQLGGNITLHTYNNNNGILYVRIRVRNLKYLGTGSQMDRILSCPVDEEWMPSRSNLFWQLPIAKQWHQTQCSEALAQCSNMQALYLFCTVWRLSNIKTLAVKEMVLIMTTLCWNTQMLSLNAKSFSCSGSVVVYKFA